MLRAVLRYNARGLTSQIARSIYFDKFLYWRVLKAALPRFIFHIIILSSGLDMSPFTLGKGNSGEKEVYDLFAVTNHSGTVNFGHYTAFACLNESNSTHVNGLNTDTGSGELCFRFE